MVKVEKTTYGATPKNNELTKLTRKTKQTIQKIEEEKKTTKNKTKQNNQWLCKINSIDKKRTPEVSIRKWNIKKK